MKQFFFFFSLFFFKTGSCYVTHAGLENLGPSLPLQPPTSAGTTGTPYHVYLRNNFLKERLDIQNKETVLGNLKHDSRH